MTARILRKYFQYPRSYLYIAQNEALPDRKVNAVYRIKQNDKGWAIIVCSTNGTLFGFFDYLRRNLDELLLITEKKNIIFAGLFDAEGNVSLDDACVRWSCLHKKRLKIYIEHLSSMRLFDRYDGAGNMVSYNLLEFEKQILPHLRHPKKNQRPQPLAS